MTNDQYFSSKGILLSIHDFQGDIQLINNTINNNFIYIPSAAFTNHPKYSNTEFEQESQNAGDINTYIRDVEDNKIETMFSDTLFFEVLSNTKLSSTDHLHFMNYYRHKEFDTRDKGFQSYSCIFIENVHS